MQKAKPIQGLLQEGTNCIVESATKLFENRVEQEWLTTKEAAYFLGITPNALTIMVHRGQVRVFKFGRRLRFRFADLRALFKRKGA